jgi:hypothetical protein
MRNRLGTALALATVAAVSLGFAGEAAAATTIRCAIPRVGYGDCNSDNVTVSSGQKVYIDLNSSGGKEVKFQLRNKQGGHRLTNNGPWQKPIEGAFFMWTNNTNRSITIDVFADAKPLRQKVSAIANIDVR